MRLFLWEEHIVRKHNIGQGRSTNQFASLKKKKKKTQKSGPIFLRYILILRV